jgi:ABC-type multidrug transport system fused ATPase/permease subunit
MCFSLAWLQQLLIWAVIVGAIIAILQLFVPWVLSQVGDLGGAVGVILQVIRIIVWAVIVIFVIYFVFDLISCLTSSGALRLPKS